MRDKNFEIFIEEMGEATSREEVPISILEKYQGLLPEVLLEYWKVEGWCSYADGLFWTVNPDEYRHILDMWLEGTLFQHNDRYHVIARSAFGDLYAWGEKYNRKLTVACPTHSIIALANEVNVPAKNPNLAIQTFFTMSDKEAYDMEDNQGEFLFQRALGKLGPLDKTELYGFQPALVLGGPVSIDNLTKLNLEVHLTILRQLAQPRVPFGELRQ